MHQKKMFNLVYLILPVFIFYLYFCGPFSCSVKIFSFFHLIPHLCGKNAFWTLFRVANRIQCFRISFVRFFFILYENKKQILENFCVKRSDQKKWSEMKWNVTWHAFNGIFVSPQTVKNYVEIQSTIVLLPFSLQSNYKSYLMNTNTLTFIPSLILNSTVWKCFTAH